MSERPRGYETIKYSADQELIGGSQDAPDTTESELFAQEQLADLLTTEQKKKLDEVLIFGVSSGRDAQKKK